jgi:hypothetical protein
LPPWNAKRTVGTSAKKPRKNTTSPTGTSPASRISTYITEKMSVAASLSRIPRVTGFTGG